MFRLSFEQQEVLKVVESGHNVLITGQAGTGKSFLVKEIFRRLERAGKNVSIVCSSGIAGTVYSDLKTTVPTVHSFYGLRTADLPWQALVERSAQDNLLGERIKALDCLIWDEISMSSERIFQIANLLHLEINGTKDSSPFNGIQVILVGEFLQLRPVPNFLDPGQFMFNSPVFEKAISHRYELKTVMRQDDSEKDFVQCLKEVREGRCSFGILGFIKGLKRHLSPELESEAVHIFFKKLSTQLFNLDKLQELPGDEHRFAATDEGDTTNMSCPAEQVLVLKPGCKVMLTWNRSDGLRNGSAGIYIGMDGDKMIVEFKEIGKVSLKREVWHKRGKHGDFVGRRTQYPVILMYAITCHKAQGLTLPAAVVHCSKEFVPGLAYVSFSRVKKSSHLQVLNFNHTQLLPAVPSCMDVCKNNREIQNDLKCCRHNYLLPKDLQVVEGSFEVDAVEDEDTGLIEEVSEQCDKVVNSFFERGDPDELFIDLNTIYAVLTEETSNDFMKTLPQDINMRKLIMEMKVKEPLSDYANEKNYSIDGLLECNDQHLNVFGNIMWGRACQIILEESLLDISEVHVSTKQWSFNTNALFMLTTRSTVFLNDLKLFFNVEQLSQVQISIGTELVNEIYKMVVNAVATLVRKVELDAPIIINIREMPSEALAKVRHVGAWAVAKVFHSKAKYVKLNMASKSTKTLNTVRKELDLCNLLEENAIANFSQLSASSKYVNTLSVTEERQYRSRGLTHIEDGVYEFFIEVEEMRVNSLNDCKLKASKQNLFEDTLERALKNEHLLHKWTSCFPEDTDQVQVLELFKGVVKKFMMAGACQYMRDYRLLHRLKKSAEHRKKVLQKKNALEEKKALPSYDEIVQDKSVRRISSHHLLLAYIEKYGSGPLIKNYTKAQLITLCKAYGVKFKQASKKAVLGASLITAMKESDSMIHPFYLINLQSQVNFIPDNTGQQERIVLRISRAP